MAKKSAQPPNPSRADAVLTPAQKRQAAESAAVRNAPVNRPRTASPAENARTVGGAVKNLLGLGTVGRVVDSASKKR